MAAILPARVPTSARHPRGASVTFRRSSSKGSAISARAGAEAGQRAAGGERRMPVSVSAAEVTCHGKKVADGEVEQAAGAGGEERRAQARRIGPSRAVERGDSGPKLRRGMDNFSCRLQRADRAGPDTLHEGFRSEAVAAPAEAASTTQSSPAGVRPSPSPINRSKRRPRRRRGRAPPGFCRAHAAHGSPPPRRASARTKARAV